MSQRRTIIRTSGNRPARGPVLQKQAAPLAGPQGFAVQRLTNQHQRLVVSRAVGFRPSDPTSRNGRFIFKHFQHLRGPR